MTIHLQSLAAALTTSVSSSPVFRTLLEDYDTDDDHLAGPPLTLLIGAIVTGFFLLLTLIPAGIFIYQHNWRLRHEPSLQISIIRSRIIPIISLIPIFACSSYLSVVFPDIGFYIHPIRLVTTGYCIYAFLRFLLEMLGGDKRAFIALRDQPARPLYNAFPFLCCIPMGPKPFTQTTLTVAKSLLYQAVVILPLTAAAEMVIYWSEEQVAMPVLELLNFASVLFCSYGLGIFYRASKDILYAHKPFVKFFTVTFMLMLLVSQKLFFSLLVYTGAIAPREGIAKTVQIEGWHAFCLVFETLIMQLMMQKTFPGPEFDNGISLTDDPTKPKRESTLDSLDDLPTAADKGRRAPRKGGVIDGEDEDEDDEDDNQRVGNARGGKLSATAASLSMTPKASPTMKDQHAPSPSMPKPSFFSRIIKSPVAALPDALPDPVNDIALKGERDSFNKWKKEREQEEQKLRSREEAVEKKASEEDERRKKRSESHARTRSAVPNSALLSKVFNVPEKKEEAAAEDKKGKKKGFFGKKSKDKDDEKSSKKGGAAKTINKLLGKEEKPKEKLNFVQKAKKKYVKAVDTANMVLKVTEGM